VTLFVVFFLIQTKKSRLPTTIKMFYFNVYSCIVYLGGCGPLNVFLGEEESSVSEDTLDVF